jgi:L-alanine-DL-glutamate epimerase-like enolase superfamily enzyme
MQITKVEVFPVNLKLRIPIRMADISEINQVTAIFVRMEIHDGRSAWGCSVANPDPTNSQLDDVLRSCQACADLTPDLHPLDIEYSINRLRALPDISPAAICAFDLAFHDLLGLAAGMPLYRLLGGYRHKIQTSATVFLGSVRKSVEHAKMRARHGFKYLKIKGGLDPELDVRRVQAIHRALPHAVLRLDADGAYSIKQALEVTRVLEDRLEMIEQPTAPDDVDALWDVTRHSSVPVLADQSITGPASALVLATYHQADGFSIKVATCGGLRCAQQMDGIARAAQLTMMVSCVIEPALLTAAGLHFALSSPNIQYADLDGYLDLVNDPTVPGFTLQDGCLIATDVPGLGCTVNL